MNALSKYYSRPIESPKSLRDGLANFVELIIHALENNNPDEALYLAVDLREDITGDANPYRIGEVYSGKGAA